MSYLILIKDGLTFTEGIMTTDTPQYQNKDNIPEHDDAMVLKFENRMLSSAWEIIKLFPESNEDAEGNPLDLPHPEADPRLFLTVDQRMVIVDYMIECTLANTLGVRAKTMDEATTVAWELFIERVQNLADHYPDGLVPGDEWKAPNDQYYW